MRKTIKVLSLLLLTFIYCFSIQAQTKEPVPTGEERVKMFASHKAMKEESSYKDLHWQYIGPTNISGRCTDVEAVIPRGDSCYSTEHELVLEIF